MAWTGRLNISCSTFNTLQHFEGSGAICGTGGMTRPTHGAQRHGNVALEQLAGAEVPLPMQDAGYRDLRQHLATLASRLADALSRLPIEL